MEIESKVLKTYQSVDEMIRDYEAYPFPFIVAEALKIYASDADNAIKLRALELLEKTGRES